MTGLPAHEKNLDKFREKFAAGLGRAIRESVAVASALSVQK
jgi:hypothetical protein